MSKSLSNLEHQHTWEENEEAVKDSSKRVSEFKCGWFGKAVGGHARVVGNQNVSGERQFSWTRCCSPQTFPYMLPQRYQTIQKSLQRIVFPQGQLDGKMSEEQKKMEAYLGLKCSGMLVKVCTSSVASGCVH